MSIDITNYFDDVPCCDEYGTWHVNHGECSDMRGRLYISRYEDKPDIVLAYCHNCGDKGVHIIRATKRWVNAFKATKKEKPEPLNSIDCAVKEPPLFEGYFPKTIDWPDHAIDYIYQYGMQNIAYDYGVRWDVLSNSLLYPQLDDYYSMDKARILMYQSRHIPEKGNVYNGPKYRTVKFTEDWQRPIRMPRGGCDKLVIVEDYLSAIKVNYYTGIDTLCLWGSHLQTRTLLDMALYYKAVIVWLDNDNTIIDKKASEIYTLCHSLGLVCKRIYNLSDPKKYDGSELKKQLGIA